MKSILINPFHRIAGINAFIAGIGILLISALLASFTQLRYDGVLDAHFFNEPVSFKSSVFEQSINLVSIFVIFYPIALLSGAKHTRAIDIAGTFALARAPFILLPLFNINNYMNNLTQPILDSLQTNTPIDLSLDISQIVVLTVFIILIIFIVVWMVTLMFHAYKVSTNLKGNRLIVTFITGVLISEILSKIILSQINL